jgi:hypothetical protein
MRRVRRSRQGLALLMAALMLQGALGPAVALALVEQQPPAPQPGPLLVGVLELDPNNVDAGEARAIAERLRLYLGRQRIGGQVVFQVIERNKMETIMQELGFQLSGACDTDECVVQVGKVLGASKMVAGSVSKVGTLYSLQVRIVDMQTSKIEQQAFADVDGIELVLTEATQSVAAELAAAVQGTQPAPQPVVQQPVVQQPQPEVRQPAPQEESQPAVRKKSKWWLWILVPAVVGGGAAVALGGGQGVSAIGEPPVRPVPPAN